MTKETIRTAAAPAAIGPYSQGVRAGDFIFTAGQIGLDPATMTLREGVDAQAQQVMANLAAILAAAGATLDDVVKTTIFLADMADFEVVNKIYASGFSAAPPARSTVQVSVLPRRALVEIEAVAYVPRP